MKKIFTYFAIFTIIQGIINSQTNSTNQSLSLENKTKIIIPTLKNKNDTSLDNLITLQPLNFWNSFFSGFSIIFVAEIGDRTFLLIMIYAITNHFFKTLVISNSVLLTWNFLSILIGYNMPYFLNKNVIEWVGILTFTIFGCLMIKDGYFMESKYVIEEFEEEQENLVKQNSLTKKQVADLNHETTNNKNTHDEIRSDNDLQQPLVDKRNDVEKNNGNSSKKESENINVFNTIWGFSFSLLMGELGDKSQIASIVIGATQHFYGVLLGTSLAHFICTIIAIGFGKIFSKFITTKEITLIGGSMFLLFAGLFLFAKL